MGTHRTFNADRFLDKFQGREPLIRRYVRLWDGHLKLDGAKLDVPELDVSQFKEFLANGDGDGKDELVEGLYRACDLCTDHGHEALFAACADFNYDPDPNQELPVECLSLKVRVGNEDAFRLAYDRNTVWLAERFSFYRGKAAKTIGDPAPAATRFEKKLGEFFKDDKKSDRVLVRQYREGDRTNFIVYHEKRTKAELIFKGTQALRKVAPTVFRPLQQDFISYNHKTGQVEIEARFEKEEDALRKHFAECCLGDADFFEGAEAANGINLSRIAEENFKLDVDEGHTATLIELSFRLQQQPEPSFHVRSKNVLETLERNDLRRRIAGAIIQKAVFKITFPDDRRGKRVELAGANTVAFKRATHAEEVFSYLTRWGLVSA